MKSFVNNGLFGKEVSKWLAAGPDDLRGVVFLVGAILFVLLMAGLWNKNKILIIALDIVFGVLFGFPTAAGVFGIELVLGQLGKRNQKSRAAETRNTTSEKQRNNEKKMSDLSERALEELDKQGRELLEIERYKDLHSQISLCKTDDDVTYLVLAWDTKLKEAWEDIHRYDD